VFVSLVQNLAYLLKLGLRKWSSWRQRLGGYPPGRRGRRPVSGSRARRIHPRPFRPRAHSIGIFRHLQDDLGRSLGHEKLVAIAAPHGRLSAIMHWVEGLAMHHLEAFQRIRILPPR
jgi:hypothetical protein